MTDMTQKPDLIEIAFIRGAHGLRGQVMVHAHSLEEESLTGYGPLSSLDGSRQFKLKVTGVKGKDFICAIDGVNDRNAAEALRGTKLFIAADKLPETEEGEYYIKDLEGLSAVTLEGVTVGKVLHVTNFGVHDALEIRFIHDGQKPLEKPQTEFLLFTDENVPEVDLDNGIVTVNLPIGLLEMPEKPKN